MGRLPVGCTRRARSRRESKRLHCCADFVSDASTGQTWRPQNRETRKKDRTQNERESEMNRDIMGERSESKVGESRRSCLGFDSRGHVLVWERKGRARSARCNRCKERELKCSQKAFPAVVGAMMPLRMTKSPKCSPSLRSRANDLIMGRRISRISDSLTDSR